MLVEKVVVRAEMHLASMPMNCYLLSSDDDSCVIIIDPGGERDRILKAVGQRTIGAIVLTHRHIDHCGALKTLRDLWETGGVPLYAHPLESSALTKMLMERGYPELAEALSKAFKPLNGGDTLDACDLSLHVLHTPGHSAGSICLFDEESKILIAGDTIFRGTTGRTDLESGSPYQMHETLQLLAQLPDETTIYPGHDELTTILFERTRALVEY